MDFFCFLPSSTQASFSLKNLKKQSKESIWDIKTKIDQVIFEGVHSIHLDKLEKDLFALTGHQLEKEKILQIEEQIQSIYFDHGYQDVQISSHLIIKKNKENKTENILKFSIQEGPVIKISEIQFKNSEDNFDKNQLLPYLKIHTGEALNSNALHESIQKIQEFFASSQYIGTKINAQTTLVKTEKNKTTTQWVRVTFVINPGNHVLFGFRGNKIFTKNYLDSLIQEQRILGLSKDYLNVIQKKIESEYHALGYLNVKITPYTFSKNKDFSVIFFITEGEQKKIESIHFDGQFVFQEKDLLENLISRAPSLIKNFIYVEKDLEKATELLIEWIKSQGYLAARIVSIQVSDGLKKTLPMKVTIYLYEGEQTQINAIEIEGATQLNSSEISEILKIQKNKPLNLFEFQDNLSNLNKTYWEKGYLDFKILNLDETTQNHENLIIQYSNKNRHAKIFLKLHEGPLFRFSKIDIQGLLKTKETIISREIHFKKNDVIKQSDLIQIEDKIKKMGIFSAIDLTTIDTPNEPGYKTIQIFLKESDRGSITYGPGYRNDLGIRLFGNLTYSNLWGKNHTIAFSAITNRRFQNYHFLEGQLQLSYSWPWFLIPHLNFQPMIAQTWTQYINFSAITTTLAANWERELLSHPHLTAQLGYTFERIQQIDAIVSSDNGQFYVAAIGPKLSLDLRDSRLTPKEGAYSVLWADLALPALGSQNSPDPIAYYRLQARQDYYLPLSQEIIWYFSFRTGYEETIPINNSKTVFIPLIKEFALGGVASIRGYAEQEINNPYSLVNSNLSYVNYRTQLNVPFFGSLKLGLFLDAGNLLVNQFSFGRLKYGTGFGFHYETPVGPLNLDCGFKINSPPGSSPYMINFSVGII